ncbi:MAG: response regulator transcription factor [Hyphomicrobiales bacterium]
MRILVVEDDVQAAHYLIEGLRQSGHVADHVGDGEQGIEVARDGLHDMLIIDRLLPGLDGLAVVETLRREGIATPVLILSALGDVDDKVDGLRAGGDDYLPKPYVFAELLARVESLARRKTPTETKTRLVVGPLEMDLLSRRVRRARREIILQPREFRLLEYLMKNAGRVVTRTMLLEKLWDYHFDPQTNVIDVHISRLRAKIDRGFDEPLLHTIRGAGYLLRAPATKW